MDVSISTRSGGADAIVWSYIGLRSAKILFSQSHRVLLDLRVEFVKRVKVGFHFKAFFIHLTLNTLWLSKN